MRHDETPAAAVALRYDGTGAPRVSAKGRGDVADRILSIAREHGIPVRQDRDLVRILALVDLGEEVPPDLYRAVAEVLAFAYRLSGKGLPARTPGGTASP